MLQSYAVKNNRRYAEVLKGKSPRHAWGTGRHERLKQTSDRGSPRRLHCVHLGNGCRESYAQKVAYWIRLYVTYMPSDRPMAMR